MTADVLLRGIGQLVTPPRDGPVHGLAMRDLDIIENAAIAVTNGQIAWVGRLGDWNGESRAVYDCDGSAILPALVDPHTHAIWLGDRLADFEARASGASYEQILKSGGGIRSTIRHTSAGSLRDLVSAAKPRIEALTRAGAATVEVKSGYGFDPQAEMRMLEAVQILGHETPARLIPTLLIHIPPANSRERHAYLQQVLEELIPDASRSLRARALDVFVEREAWAVDEGKVLLEWALKHGLQTKLHTDQFHRCGGLELGIAAGVLSVDHLEASDPAQFPALASSSTIATLVPGVTLHLGIPPAPGRAMIDAGAAVAVGTDLNPGSSPIASPALALALSVRLNGVTPAEALTAGTVNAAAALGLHDCGRIAPGCRADLIILHTSDWRDLVYQLGSNPVREIWIAGKQVPR